MSLLLIISLSIIPTERQVQQCTRALLEKVVGSWTQVSQLTFNLRVYFSRSLKLASMAPGPEREPFQLSPPPSTGHWPFVLGGEKDQKRSAAVQKIHQQERQRRQRWTKVTSKGRSFWSCKLRFQSSKWAHIGTHFWFFRLVRTWVQLFWGIGHPFSNTDVHIAQYLTISHRNEHFLPITCSRLSFSWIKWDGDGILGQSFSCL